MIQFTSVFIMATGYIFLTIVVVHCLLVSGTDVLSKDPCSNVDDKTIVVTMCEKGSASEHQDDGSIKDDSVILRVAKHQENCVCSVRITWQVDEGNDFFYLQKYNHFNDAAPNSAKCGLAIDISLADRNETLVDTLDPIKCLEGYNRRLFSSPDYYKLYLTSRKTDDSLINGYCLQFFRDSTNTTLASLHIECYNPLQDGVSTAETITSDSTNGQHGSILSTISGEQITSSTVINTSRIFTTTSLNGSNNHLDEQSDMKLENGNQALYIIAGSSVGGGIFICIFIAIIICKCRKRKNVTKRQTNNDNEDRDSYGLKDNILYVSSNDINTFVGNYAYVDSNTNTAEEEIAKTESKTRREKDNTLDLTQTNPTVKPKPSNSREDDIDVMYAVVSK